MSEVATLEILIKVKEQNPNALKDLENRLRATDSTAKRTSTVLGGTLANATQRAAEQALKLSQAEARGLSIAGSYAAAHDKLSQGIQRFSQAADSSTNSLLRLQNAENQLGLSKAKLDGSSRTLTDSFNRLEGKMGGLKAGMSGLASVAGSLGVAFGAQQVISFGVEAGKAALSLDKADKTLRAVTGSAAAYGEALATAKQQQTLFGGSLQSNIEGLTGLSITARQSGADLKQLVDLSQRLGTLDPTAGTGGARVALSEALSGDITSLARRYEIPKDKIAALRDESTTASEKLAILDQYLNKIGITSETTAGAISKQAQAFNAFGAALDTVTTTVGGAIAGAFAPLAQAGADAINGFGTDTSEAFINAAIGADTLARAMSGLAPASAASRAAAFEQGNAFLQLIGVESQATITAREKAAADTQAANASAARGAIENSTYGAIQQTVAATAAATQATQEHITSVTADAAQQLAAQAASQELALAKNTLAQQAQIAANALLASGQSGANAAAVLAGSSGSVDVLTAAYYRLAAAQAAAGKAALTNGAGKADRNTRRVESRDRGSDLSNRNSDAIAQGRKEVAANKKASDDLRAAKDRQTLSTGNAAAQQSVYNQRLAEATKLYGANSVQAIDAATAVKQFEQSQAKAGAKGGKGGGGGGKGAAAKLSDQQKLNNSLLLDEQKTNNKFEDAELKHVVKMLDIEKAYQEKSKKAQQAFNLSSLSSRRGFYAQQGSIEDAGIRQAASAAYEAAAQESKKIASEQGADVAQAYLDAQKTAIQDDSQIAQDIASAQKDGDTGKAEYLSGVRDLARQENQARIDAVKSGGSEIANERSTQLAEETLAYEESQGKIADSATRSAEQRVFGAKLAGKEIDAEKLKVDDLAKSYDALGVKKGTGGAASPVTATQTPADATTAPSTLDGLLTAVNAMREAVVAAIVAVDRTADRGLSGVQRAVSSRSVG